MSRWSRSQLLGAPPADANGAWLPEVAKPHVILLVCLLVAIPISLGPEDADGRRGDGRQGGGSAGRRRALEGEVAHLALDGAGVVARAPGREALGADFG